MTGIELDGRRLHPLGKKAFHIWINRPILLRDGVEQRFVMPRCRCRTAPEAAAAKLIEIARTLPIDKGGRW